MKRWIVLLAVLVLALPRAAAAHPHIYVDTGLKLVADGEGRITGVEVTWRYDEFFSLLVLEDMGLDGDGDGQLTGAEMAELNEFDMHWVEGYEGDLVAASGGEKLVLGPPQPLATRMDEGRIETRHYRALPGPVAAGQTVALKAFDPVFYTAYDLSLGIDAPEGCKVAIARADIGAAQQKLLDELAQIPADEDSEYPNVGETFADEVRVTCGGS